MFELSKKLHALVAIMLIFSCIPIQAFSLRDARELCKQHRFKILAITSIAVAYMYTHKILKKAIQDYHNPTVNELSSHKEHRTDYCEAFADAFIKTTKLVGTIFKVFRATTCPDEGKVSGDQWLDDFSQMA